MGWRLIVSPFLAPTFARRGLSRLEEGSTLVAVRAGALTRPVAHELASLMEWDTDVVVNGKVVLYHECARRAVAVDVHAPFDGAESYTCFRFEDGSGIMFFDTLPASWSIV